jgi:hypothetical protein
VTTRDFNPLPAGLTEADLLALVEGEALPRERAGVVAKAVAANPALARELEAMKRDREHLRALGDVKAPSGLMDSVEAALQPVFERQMLLGLAEGDNIHERPPVSMVVPRRAPLLSGRRLAIAAGIALVAGGVAFTVLAPSIGGGPAPMPGRSGPIARNTQAPAEITPPQVAPQPETALAKGDAPAGAIGAVASAGDDPQYGPLPSEADTGAVAMADTEPSDPAGPPAPEAIGAAQAVALAAEHRLVIRVIPSDGRFDRITEKLAVRPKGAWQLAGAAPIELASLLDAQSGRPLPDGSVPDRSHMASDRGAPDVVSLPGPPGPPDYAAAPSVYLINARMDEGTFQALEASLRDTGADVLFEESAQALPMDSAPITTPAAVLWWGSGPSGWAVWGSVPVVIQR